VRGTCARVLRPVGLNFGDVPEEQAHVAGVAGIDFGLRLVAELTDPMTACALELALEYDPEPPFRSGHRRIADPSLVARVTTELEKRAEARGVQIARVLR